MVLNWFLHFLVEHGLQVVCVCVCVFYVFTPILGGGMVNWKCFQFCYRHQMISRRIGEIKFRLNTKPDKYIKYGVCQCIKMYLDIYIKKHRFSFPFFELTGAIK